ncbi:hypothetical protein DP83_17675 [Vibrio metoecus]|uniref:Transposase n=1 Tax=Vibrio metoecus TaxID=1481663 RepID=A0ABR4RUG2_VIBMT|nr:hypothetical protein DP83_17675 [Vibrio metoecus]
MHKGVMLHSNERSHYICRSYRQLLQRYQIKQSATRLSTNLTTAPELAWVFKHWGNILLDIIADRCTSKL